jgi:multidrug resistance efflux pump
MLSVISASPFEVDIDALAHEPGVTFDGVAAAFTANSGTYVDATVPTGATTGPVVLTLPTGALTSNVNFRVQL